MRDEIFPVRAISEDLTKTMTRASGDHPHSAAVREVFNATFMGLTVFPSGY
jgi:hypothetical protein